MFKKYIVSVMLLLTLASQLYSNNDSKLMIGGELYGTLTMPTMNIAGVSQATTDNTIGYGAGFIGEYRIVDYLGLGFGLGGRYYTMTGTMASAGNIEYSAFAIDIPLSLRFYPIPLFNKSSDFSVFLGVGCDLQLVTYSLRTSPNKHFQILDSHVGLLGELGMGYNVTKSTVIQLTGRYNMGLIDADRLSRDKIIPSFIEWSLGVLFRL